MLDEHGCLGKPTSARPEKFVRFLFVPKIKDGELLDRADLRPTLRGDLMTKHVHFEDTTAPVARTESYKLACALAVQLGLTAYIGDVPKAFYGSEPDIKGIMALCPPGYPLDAAGDFRNFQAPPLYAEVERMIPGFPQSSRVFNLDLVKKLTNIKWTQAVNDPCVFLPPPGKKGIVLFHVDDISAFLPDEKCAKSFYGLEGLGQYWPKLTFRLMDKALGITYVSNFTPLHRSIFMHQKDYAEAMLERFSMADCKPASTPAPPGLKYSKMDCEDKSTGDTKMMTQSQFLSIIMSVSWLAVNTRFDLKFALSKLASYVAAPGLLHKKALQHLLRYIKATVHFGIEFLASGPPIPYDSVVESLSLITYTDASHHDDVDSSASTIAFVNFLNGSPISMCSKLTKEVKSSINHGEVFAVAEALPGQSESIIAVNKSQRDAIWITNMMAEMIGVSREAMPSTPILIDNTGALKLIQDAIQHTANKQILHHLHELRERILAGRFYAVKVSTDDNLADAGTKQLATAEASRRLLAFLAAPIGKRPAIVHEAHIIDAMLKAKQQWQASRPVHAHSSVRIGEASHPGPTDELQNLRPSSALLMGLKTPLLESDITPQIERQLHELAQAEQSLLKLQGSIRAGINRIEALRKRKRRLGDLDLLEDEAGQVSGRSLLTTSAPQSLAHSSTAPVFDFDLHTTRTPLGVELNSNATPAIVQNAASQGIHFAFRSFKYEEVTPEELELQQHPVDAPVESTAACTSTTAPSLGQGGMLDG
jgi:hypothetical protein